MRTYLINYILKMNSIVGQKTLNVLLSRDDVGKARQPTVKLPPEGFSYGKPDLKDCEGAKQG